MTQQGIRITADAGKTFVKKGTDTVIGSEIWLGKGDNAENYEEIDIPKPKENED